MDLQLYNNRFNRTAPFVTVLASQQPRQALRARNYRLSVCSLDASRAKKDSCHRIYKVYLTNEYTMCILSQGEFYADNCPKVGE